MIKKFPFIGIRALREIIGRKFADRVKIEPVFIQPLGLWVGWKSNGEYELFPENALPHDEGRPVCLKIDNELKYHSQHFLKYYNETNVHLSA